MSRSQNSFIKQQREKKKAQKRKEKEERRKVRQENNNKGGDIASMLAYVDEYGNITSEPPADNKKEDKKEDHK